MATHKEQEQCVFALDLRGGINGWRPRFVGRGQREDPALATAASDLAPHMVGETPRGHLDQPPSGVFGEALFGPLKGGGEKCFLHRVFGGSKVAEPTDQSPKHLRREFTQQVLGRRVEPRRRHSVGGGPLMTWRTSMAMLRGAPPRPGAAEALAAISYARSVVGTSTIQ